MQFQPAPAPSHFRLERLTDHPLTADGISVARVSADGVRIGSLPEVEQILDLAGPATVVLFPRAVLGSEFLKAILLDSQRGQSAGPENATTRWNETGGIAASNAIPHIHDHFNCHAVPIPSEVATAFFNRQSIIDAIEVARFDRSVPRDIRLFLSECLKTGSTDDIFFTLHGISERFSHHAVMCCIKKIQDHAAQTGGFFEVELGVEQNGMVGIPAFAVHARSLNSDFVRATPSAWRYFGAPYRRDVQ